MTNLRILLALALALALGTLARAQDFTLDHGVVGAVRSPWPSKASRGYAPIFCDVQNTGERATDVTIEVDVPYRSPSQPVGVSRVRLELGPGERREVELLQPLHRSYGYPLYVRVQSERRTFLVQLMTASEAADPSDRLVAWVTPRPLVAGAVERMGSDLSASDPASGSSVSAPSPHGTGYGFVPSMSSSAEWVVFALEPRDLPSRAAAWSSVDVVVVDARAGEASLASCELEPVASFARQGGLVVVLGDRAALARLVGDGALLDARLRDGAFGLAGESWRYGVGRVAWMPESAGELVDATYREALVSAVARTYELPHRVGPYVPGTPAMLEAAESVAIPGLGELPTQVFVLLLVAFAICIGPVNLFVLRRIGRPGLLLVTIPVISLVASLGVLGFGILSQGIDLKGALHSFTLLDQRTGRATTLARYALMPGLAIGAIVPERGTTVHPTAYAFEQGRQFVVEHGDGLRLTGSWAPVRVSSNLLVSSDAPARAKLEVRRAAEGLEVTNTLTVALRHVHVCDAAGAVYAMNTADVLEPGATATLSPAPGLSTSAGINVVSAHAFETKSAWYAVADTNPFVDTLGLEPNLKESVHVLQGILPASEADWSK